MNLKLETAKQQARSQKHEHLFVAFSTATASNPVDSGLKL
jgi:hypothetical protein